MHCQETVLMKYKRLKATAFHASAKYASRVGMARCSFPKNEGGVKAQRETRLADPQHNWLVVTCLPSPREKTRLSY